MPSPSPTSRGNSSASSRNLSASSRMDLLAPRGLQQSFHATSSNSSENRALHVDSNDHKENSMENLNGRAAIGRPNQNLKGPSKKPWVTHFAKPAATLSPSNRILVDRNSSYSPVRSTIASGNGENPSDKKEAKTTTPREVRTTPVKGVAELSKRIQQFLEDQDVLLGVKTGSSHEVTSACSSITPVEQGQHPLSPYNPYKSPFSERPKFLRLHGNVSPMEAANTVHCIDGINMLMKPTEEELPLFEGDQALVTPLQQIQFSASLPSSSTEDEEVSLRENSKEQILGAVADEEASVDALEAKVLLTPEGEGNCLNELEAAITIERTAKIPEEDDEARTFEAQNDFQDEDTAKQAKNQQEEVHMTDAQVKNGAVNVTPQEGFQVIHNQDSNLSVELAKIDEDVDTLDGDDEVSLGKKVLRVMSCGAILASFLTLVLLSSASSGLLPPPLVNNPINSFWQSSKYHEHSMMLLRGMDGLWTTEMMYYPTDAHVELFQGISELSNQAHQKVQLYVQVASSILDDWVRVLVQYLSFSMDTEKGGEHEDRARQFEWIQDYDFEEEEWVDEIPTLAYTDWELLYEYDLGAANQFVLGSIPESLKNDLQRNFSRLSDSPEVKDLLEDLMKLKGGSTEEDRLEVLQYFWEYVRFSASAHESLMKFQATAVVDSHSEHQGLEFGVETDHDQGQETMQSDEHIEENHYQTFTEEHSKPFKDSQLDEPAEHRLEVGIEQEQELQESSLKLQEPQSSGTASEKLQESMVSENSQTLISTVDQDAQLDELAEHHLQKVGIKEDQIVPETSHTASEKLQELKNKNSHTVVSAVYEHDAAWTSSVHELQREVGNAETSSTEIQPSESTSDVRLDITQLAALATFITASFFILGRNRRSKNISEVISHASSIEFLRKSYQPRDSFNDEMHQNMQPFIDAKKDKKVTMIEELNDRLDSVLQSPDPNNLHLNSFHARKDEDLIRSPIPGSATSPYGSFTTYKMVSKKEGQAMETKLTPVRRSSRIRNHVGMSPNTNGVRRIAISPP